MEKKRCSRCSFWDSGYCKWLDIQVGIWVQICQKYKEKP